MKLDDYQRMAACYHGAYCAIIAGAGTGKTYTLLGRISYLVHEVGMKPEEILVISYTNETVREFMSKVKQHLGFTVTVLTFHKLALYLLDQAHIVYSVCSEDYLSYILHEVVYGLALHSEVIQKAFLRILFPFYNFYWKDFQKWRNSKEMKEIQKQILQFIHMYYAKGLDETWLTMLIFQNFGKSKAFYFLVFLVIQIYESELESQWMVDFDSMISLAIQSLCKVENIPFRHILVDEFQDTSKIRMDLLALLVQKFSMGFTVVGDDCQSIYRFSGTENNCFSLLQKNFPDTQFFYLKYTYRNSQELIQMANHFILKNKMQFKKEILSFQHMDWPIEVIYYRSYSSIFKILEYISPMPEQSILFLGRNSFDWKYYFRDSEICWKDKKHFSLVRFPGVIFTFLTVHQSKGLEADVVILLHLEQGVYGFPNQVVMPSYFSWLLQKDAIAFEEERRLFYVALTRTRKKVFLITSLAHPSFFVKELVRDFKTQIKISFF